MEAKLIKSEYYHYILEDNNGNLIGSISDNDSIYKLSLKNCEAIENGYDLDGWDVEIEMDFAIYPANLPKEGEERPVMKPKLDTNGYLILKTK